MTARCTVFGESYIEVAAIPVPRFTSKWQPPHTLKIAVHKIPTPPYGEKTEVVLVKLDSSIPNDVFFFKWKMAAQVFLTRTEVVLASNDVHRLGQAQETFEVETQQQETFASKLGKPNSWNGVETIDSIIQKFDNFQADRTLTSNARGFQEKAANVGGSGSENEGVKRVFSKCRWAADADH